MIKTLKQTIQNIFYWIKKKLIQFKSWVILIIFGAAVVAAPLVAPQVYDVDLEKIQDKYEASELKDKYRLDGASLVKKEIKNPELDKYKGESKDEIEITIGDKDSDEFTPNIELKRWNEISFKIKPKGLDNVAKKDKKVKFDKDKIKFDMPDMSYEMYDYEDGYKYVWYLNKEPKKNIIEFDFETAGIDFFYQPALDIEMAGQDCWTDACTETDCCDSHRPENVVGSYAVYHQTKGGTVDKFGKAYATGKAFHIYRPHLYDADGNEAWGILNIDAEQGIYTVEIPQEFLDNAIYPIKSNDTFGYESVGGSSYGTLANKIRSTAGIPADSGDVTSITVYLASWAIGEEIKAALYQGLSSFEFATEERTTGGVTGWHTFNFSPAQSITAQIYQIAMFFDDDVIIYYDTGGAANSSGYTNAVYPTWASSLNGYTSPYSIYATYTPSGGAERRMFLTQ